jgi:uncharacterized protein YqjF (DUF2071 family)
LFLHWPVDASALRKVVPEPLEIDTFEGQAWLAIVPFRMEGVRLRGLPPIPTANAFPELNVRTYVRFEGKPGVWFFSLDAASGLAVAAARAWFGLPYFYARMQCRQSGESIEYRCERRPKGAHFSGNYRANGPVHAADEGSLEHWLVERYRLFATKRRRLFTAEIAHTPWPLQPAHAVFKHDGLAPITLPDTPPLSHFVAGVDVVMGSPLAVD